MRYIAGDGGGNRIALGWHGLPAYAVRSIRAVAEEFPVVASRAAVPFTGLDEMLPNRIHWVENDRYVTWRELGLDVPEVFFQPAWSTPCFNALGREVGESGGQVVVMFDNPWKGNWRQWLGAVRFRTQWRGRFAAAWVAGVAGHRLARFWGFPAERIYLGMYGADPEIFGRLNGVHLAERPKRMIYAGRLVPHKGIRKLEAAWRLFRREHPDWDLHVYGSGPLAEELQSVVGICLHDFLQPEGLAAAMQQARFLILPSLEEHWGVVVCEAAQSGCGLLLSDQVGSHPDLLGPKNGVLFNAGSAKSLAKALIWAAAQPVVDLARIEQESRQRGSQFTPECWAARFSSIVHDITGRAG